MPRWRRPGDWRLILKRSRIRVGIFSSLFFVFYLDGGGSR